MTTLKEFRARYGVSAPTFRKLVGPAYDLLKVDGRKRVRILTTEEEALLLSILGPPKLEKRE